MKNSPWQVRETVAEARSGSWTPGLPLEEDHHLQGFAPLKEVHAAVKFKPSVGWTLHSKAQVGLVGIDIYSRVIWKSPPLTPGPDFYLWLETGVCAEHAMFQEPHYTIQTTFESAWGLANVPIRHPTGLHSVSNTLIL